MVMGALLSRRVGILQMLKVVDVIMCMPGCPNVGAKCNSVSAYYNEHNTDVRFRHPVLIVHQTHEINTHSNGNGQSHAPQEYKCN